MKIFSLGLMVTWGSLRLSPVNCLAQTWGLLSALRGYGRNQHTAGEQPQATGEG